MVVARLPSEMKYPCSTARRRALVSGAIAAATLASSARAADLFELQGATTGGGPLVTFDETSNNLSRFVSDLVGGKGQFDALANRTYVAGLRYANVQNALRFNISNPLPNVWNANLSAAQLQPGLIERQFNGFTSQAALQSAITDYLKKDGAADYARFLQAISRRSPAGILDGNPGSATASSATGSFMEYGQRPTETNEERDADLPPAGHSGIASTADVGTFRSSGITGQTYSWTPMIPIALGEARRVRLELSLPLSYTQLEGADAYRAGAQLGVAVLVVKRTKTQPWLWQVTPQAGAVVAGSADLVDGGVLASAGVTSYVAYRPNQWEFSMGNHISFHEGMKVSVDDYTFDPKVSQQIVKNGLKIGRSLGKRWYIEAYALDTEFLQDAYTQRYTTLGLGVGYRAADRKGYIMLGTYADIGSHYQSAHLQFGTGWKF